jgi:hypothetical protein
MAAKTDQVIILPTDSGNTGKKVRAKESTVGANTVVEYFFIPSTERSETGRYKANATAAAIPTAVQTGTTTGMLYLTNPLASTVKVALSRLFLEHNFSTTLAVDLIAPILRVSRISFTGTLSAATITPAKRATADAAAQLLASAAMTGLTVTLVATLFEYVGMTMDLVTGGAGHWQAQQDNWAPDEEGDEIVLAAGEGIVVWNALAVTTANRKLTINGAWKEYT